MRHSLCLFVAMAIINSVATPTEAVCPSRGGSQARAVSRPSHFAHPAYNVMHRDYPTAYNTAIRPTNVVRSPIDQTRRLTLAATTATTKATVTKPQAVRQPVSQPVSQTGLTESGRAPTSGTQDEAVAAPVERQEIPVGVTMTFPADEFPAGGIVLMKIGPVALHLSSTTDTDGTSTVQLPEVKLMRAADAELFILTKAGKPFTTHAITLIPQGKD